MSAKPLTREQSQAATRDALLDAAEALILETSVPGLSLRAVCARAGFTQGAFYSNFASREDLLLAVMERHLEERVAALSEVTLDYREVSFDETMERVGEWLSTIVGRREWAHMAIELRLESLRNPALARSISAAEQRIDNLFAVRIEDLIAHYGLSPELKPAEIAEAMLILWRGIALRDDAAGQPALPTKTLFLTCLRALLGDRP